MLHLKTYADAPGFLADVGAYLTEDEAVNGLMLGVAGQLVHRPTTYGSMPYMAAVFRDQSPFLAALMTPPYNLILYAGQDPDLDALGLLSQDLIASRREVGGTVGPVPLTEAFAATWTGLTGARGRLAVSQRIYKLERVVHPAYSPGRLRLAAAEDAGLVVEWLEAFRQESVPGDPPMPADLVLSGITEGHTFVWDDGGPASLALQTRRTQHGATVGPVYTPPGLRRHGYASSCVAALSQQLLDAGYAFCTLYTDLGNPTSDAIYQRLGYRPICDSQVIKFDAS